MLANADKPAKTRRSRRGGKKEGAVEAAPVKKEDHPIVAETEAPAEEEAPKTEETPGETEKE
ncbi:hypothetical protein D3C86_1904630 [compost metagenome]